VETVTRVTSAAVIYKERKMRIMLLSRTFPVPGQSYWATPGGGLENNESYEQAALRELLEETGLERHSPGESVASRTFPVMLPNGETVLAEERFFLIYTDKAEIDCSRWSRNEQEVISRHRWWTKEELIQTDETVFPRDIILKILADG